MCRQFDSVPGHKLLTTSLGMRIIGLSRLRARLTFVASLCSILASGCAIPNNLEKDAKFNGMDPDAVIVFTAPSAMTIWLIEGIDDGINWSCDRNGAAYRVWPDGGFVVVKVSPRTGPRKYAIAEIDTGPNGADPKLADEGTVIPTFNAPAGRVTLVGGITLSRQGDDVHLDRDASATRERAERYLARRYPNLTEPVVGRMDWLYVQKSCNGLFKPDHRIM
jgi:hypothetical protein